MTPGERGVVKSVNVPPDLTERLLELGIAQHEAISMVGKAPLGDPVVLDLMNYRLSIRKSEADKIIMHDIKHQNKKPPR